MTIDELLIELPKWTKYLDSKARECVPQIRDALKPGTRLPQGCPSPASMALLILADVTKRMRDVQGVLTDLEKSLRSKL